MNYELYTSDSKHRIRNFFFWFVLGIGIQIYYSLKQLKFTEAKMSKMKDNMHGYMPNQALKSTLDVYTYNLQCSAAQHTWKDGT